MNTTRTIATALATFSFLLLGSCASQKTLKQYQDEVRALREERTQLKKENRDLRSQNDAYEVSLAEANVKPSTSVPLAENSELDELGIDYWTDKAGNAVISIPSEVTFPSGKAELTKKGQEALHAVARTLIEQHKGKDYWIEGHTDTDPIKESKWDSNRELSVERAMAVLGFLVEECNVPDKQCIVAGHGQYQPITPNEDNASKARNRRVEIVVHKR